MGIESVLFDLDGTLLDTAPDMGRAANIVLKLHGQPPLSDEQVRKCSSFGSRGLLLDGFNGDIPEGIMPLARKQFLDAYSADINRGTQYYPGILSLLDALDEKGLKWGIVTNKPGDLTEQLLRFYPRLESADTIVSPDTLSVAKPDPSPLLYAAQQLGTHPESCLYVGDVKSDVVAAKAANMKSGVAKWGYISDHGQISDWEPDQIFNSPTQILSLF
ncbi:HAD family hydrolase [Veronia nyctiphanis]|uniref:HAD family hydrolase n=1 Tax=Veronia nyctiphanis TaxID=1278244 RepID=A0A4V1LT18_9GAMM|nr:HAD-IA family hydrolase [Veronia nyctiphanis]RXJ73648.1 HAD family hydrolase [Veronia nyctiphanis]